MVVFLYIYKQISANTGVYVNKVSDTLLYNYNDIKFRTLDVSFKMAAEPQPTAVKEKDDLWKWQQVMHHNLASTQAFWRANCPEVSPSLSLEVQLPHTWWIFAMAVNTGRLQAKSKLSNNQTDNFTAGLWPGCSVWCIFTMHSLRWTLSQCRTAFWTTCITWWVGLSLLVWSRRGCVDITMWRADGNMSVHLQLYVSPPPPFFSNQTECLKGRTGWVEGEVTLYP